MKVTFLGTGTSQGVPVITCSCAVCTSRDPHDHRLRSSALIEVGGKTILIDCGPDFRYQMLRTKVLNLDGILLTHEHKDHIAGLDDIRAFNAKLNATIPIHASSRVHEAITRDYHYAFAKEKRPGLPEMSLHKINDLPFFMCGVQVIPIQVMHYKLPVLGFRIGNFSYVTDAKSINPQEKEKLKGSKVLVLNALQKDKHISHLNLDEAITLAKEIQAENTYLTHISHKMGLYAEVTKELPPGIHLAFDQLSIRL